MKACRKILALCLVLSLALSGCFFNSSPSVSIFDFLVWGPYFEAGTVTPDIEAMLAEIPALSDIETAVNTVSTGYAEVNSSAYAVWSMKMNAMAANGEVDMIIMEESSAVPAARGGLFLPLDELFTEEELKAFGDRVLRYRKVDPSGVEIPLDSQDAEPWTDYCGIDLSQSETLADILGPGNYAIYAVTDLGNPQRVKDVITYFANLP